MVAGCVNTLVLVANEQTQQPAPVQFDVVSVRPNVGTLKESPPSFVVHPNGLTAINWRLQMLIARAHGVQIGRIEKLPSWGRTARFDVRAKTAAPFSGTDERAMLRALLADRFTLKTHRESRMMDVYLLTRLSGAKMGQGLHQIAIDCATNRLSESSGPGMFPTDARPQCGDVLLGVRGKQGLLQARHAGVTLSSFAESLAGVLEKPVIDATNLDGRFDIEITYKDRSTLEYVSPSARAAAEEAPGQTIRDALKDQLGLTVTSSRQPIEFLVIDSVERPTPD